jgi:hypothetical protein
MLAIKLVLVIEWASYHCDLIITYRSLLWSLIIAIITSLIIAIAHYHYRSLLLSLIIAIAHYYYYCLLSLIIIIVHCCYRLLSLSLITIIIAYYHSFSLFDGIIIIVVTNTKNNISFTSSSFINHKNFIIFLSSFIAQ